MKHLLHTLLICLSMGLAGEAAAATWLDAEGLKANAALTRPLLSSNLALGGWQGPTLSAGMVAGLHGPVRATAGGGLMPGLTLQVSHASRLHLLPTRAGGAMLVLQTTP
jgi:hypothetical protein